MHRFPRTVFIMFAAAAAICIASVIDRVVYAVDRAWTRVCTWARGLGRWFIARIPKATPTWLGAWRRALCGKVHPSSMSITAYRRPLVSTRWRMCPST